METTKRNFIKKGLFAGLGSLLIPQIIEAAITEQTEGNTLKLHLGNNYKILFQGDSVTDCYRDRKITECNNIKQLGDGYPLFAAANLLESFANKNLQFYNRGISGDKVWNLQKRWTEDCIDLQPDILSILIGVNDAWETLIYDKNTINAYENNYRKLLEDTKSKLPNTQIVIGEPFSVKGGKGIHVEKWYPKFHEYQLISRKLAKEFNAIFIPYQTGMNQALKYAPWDYWSQDGIHPTLPGCLLMAKMWLKVTGLKESLK